MKNSIVRSWTWFIIIAALTMACAVLFAREMTPTVSSTTATTKDPVATTSPSAPAASTTAYITPSTPTAVSAKFPSPDDDIAPPSDVLFVAEGELRIWRAQDGAVETVYKPNAGEASPQYGDPGFTVSPAGRRVVAVANGRETFPVLMEIDLKSRLARQLGLELLARETSGRVFIDELALSREGRWLAFRVEWSSGPIGREDGQGDRLAAQAPVSGRGLYLMDPASGARPRKIADCISPLEGGDLTRSGMTWSPVEDRLAWHDNEGIWTLTPDSSPRMLASHTKSEAGDRTLFTLVSWSLGGAFFTCERGTTKGEDR